MILFSNKCGQLGNRLFAFAHLIANAREHEYTVVNMSFDEYARYFPATASDVFCRYPPRKSLVRGNRLRSVLFLLNKAILKILRKIKFKRSIVHKTVVADLPEYSFTGRRYFDLSSDDFRSIVNSNSIVFLFGRFFRDYRNFERHQEVIRDFFAPNPDLIAMRDDTINKARQKGSVVVGVHIRRGDYREFVNGKYFFAHEEYSQKMRQVTRLFGTDNVVFIICSNEPVPEEPFVGLYIVKGPGQLVADMYSLAACDYIMGPPSTFTLWASFYGKTPLYQLRDINQPVDRERFEILKPEVLYNFSFN